MSSPGRGGINQRLLSSFGYFVYDKFVGAQSKLDDARKLEATATIKLGNNDLILQRLQLKEETDDAYNQLAEERNKLDKKINEVGSIENCQSELTKAKDRVSLLQDSSEATKALRKEVKSLNDKLRIEQQRCDDLLTKARTPKESFDYIKETNVDLIQDKPNTEIDGITVTLRNVTENVFNVTFSYRFDGTDETFSAISTPIGSIAGRKYGDYMHLFEVMEGDPKKKKETAKLRYIKIKYK